VVNSVASRDVLVNAAGIIRRDKKFDLDVFTEVLEVNLISAIRVCMAAHPKLKPSGGSSTSHRC
jgi:NAD(P)-dependent dehydrogenase (short-subunit alcohol dehydrogenase family)